MSYKKILVAYDHSEPSKRALQNAIELKDAGMTEEILVVSVIDPKGDDDPALEIAARMSGVLTQDELPPEEHPVERVRTEIAEMVGDRTGISVFAVRGKAAHAIVTAATDNECDLIMMGRRGMGAISSMLGGVSTAVLRESSLPVFVTR